MSEKQLVTKDHFKDLRAQLTKIKEDNKNIVFDYDKDEKAARSHVETLRRSKKPIVERHKEQKAFFLEEGRKIDSGKNELIAAFDEMIDVHAKPLAELKAKREAEAAKEAEEARLEVERVEAERQKELEDREAKIKAREDELQRQEDERKAKEEADRLEKERLEREERLKKEAIEAERLKAIKVKDDSGKARVEILQEINVELDFESCRDMEESTWVVFFDEKNKAYQAEQNAKFIDEQRKKRGADAKEAEQKRLTDIQDVKDKAEADQKEALAKQKREQDEKERLERKRIADQKVIDDARSADVAHRKEINNEILTAILPYCKSEDEGKKLIGIMVQGLVPNTKISY